MPNPFVLPSVISGAASLAGGLVGSLTSLSSSKKQYEYQRALNEQSQEYSRENATTAYNRQRDLTKDNALLQLQGMRAAGLSTAFSDGSSVGAASNVDQGSTPAPGSAPFVANLAESFNQGSIAAASLADLSMKAAQVRNVNSDTTGKEIENQFKAAELTEKINNLKADTSSKKVQRDYQDMLNNTYKMFGQARAKAELDKAKSDAFIASSDAFYSDALNESELDKRLAEIDETLSRKDVNAETADNLRKERTLIEDRRAFLRAQVNSANASAYQSRTQGDLNKSVKTGQDLDNTLDFMLYPDKLIKSFEEVEQSKLRTLGMQIQNLPKSISEAFTREALFALERIKDGRGKASDYALVASQTAREGLLYQNENAKEWAKIMSSYIPSFSLLKK